MTFSYIQIQDFCNLINFEMNFKKLEEQDSPINLNVLVGKNGSGKSCLLDALFEIGSNNLKNKIGNEDATSFKYKMLVGNNKQNILCEKPISKKELHIPKEEKKTHLWDKVFRFYTGSTHRQNNDASNEVFDLAEDDIKWVLTALFLSGYWNEVEKCDKLKELWNKVLKLCSGYNFSDDCDKLIIPKVIWLDQDYDKEKTKKEHIEYITNYLKVKEPNFTNLIDESTIRYFWNLNSEDKIYELIKSKPLDIFNLLVNKFDKKRKTFTLNEAFINTGFLYSNYNDDNILFPDQSLSDGELAILRRFALLMMLREENINVETPEKYLILLDEPETHFNESWKTYFMYLIEEIFRDEKEKHDIFIATHSAMLVTDVKKNELHRLYKSGNGAKEQYIEYNTFGGNVVDIGRALFQMESDIGERSKNEIEAAIKGVETICKKEKDEKCLDIKIQKDKLNKLLKHVGAGEWRWKIRAKLNQLEKHNKEYCYYLKEKNKDATNNE